MLSPTINANQHLLNELIMLLKRIYVTLATHFFRFRDIWHIFRSEGFRSTGVPLKQSFMRPTEWTEVIVAISGECREATKS